MTINVIPKPCEIVRLLRDPWRGARWAGRYRLEVRSATSGEGFDVCGLELTRAQLVALANDIDGILTERQG